MTRRAGQIIYFCVICIIRKNDYLLIMPLMLICIINHAGCIPQNSYNADLSSLEIIWHGIPKGHRKLLITNDGLLQYETLDANIKSRRNIAYNAKLNPNEIALLFNALNKTPFPGFKSYYGHIIDVNDGEVIEFIVKYMDGKTIDIYCNNYIPNKLVKLIKLIEKQYIAKYF